MKYAWIVIKNSPQKILASVGVLGGSKNCEMGHCQFKNLWTLSENVSNCIGHLECGHKICRTRIHSLYNKFALNFDFYILTTINLSITYLNDEGISRSENHMVFITYVWQTRQTHGQQQQSKTMLQTTWIFPEYFPVFQF